MHWKSIKLQALLAVGGMPGSVLGAQCADRIGRRGALLAAGVLGVIGWMLIFIAQYMQTTAAFTSTLLFGRFLTGIVSGAVGILVPVSFVIQVPSLRVKNPVTLCIDSPSVSTNNSSELYRQNTSLGGLYIIMNSASDYV